MSTLVVDVPTRRQLDLIALHAAGMTFDEIAAETHFSWSTVRKEFNELRDFLAAKSLSHAIVLCIARGYVCVDCKGKVFVPAESVSLLAVA